MPGIPDYTRFLADQNPLFTGILVNYCIYFIHGLVSLFNPFNPNQFCFINR